MNAIRELLERLRCANRSYNFDYICGVGTNSEAYSYEKTIERYRFPNRSNKSFLQLQLFRDHDAITFAGFIGIQS